MHASINGLTLNAIIDSGATISAVSKAYVSDSILDRRNITPIQVGSGETIFSLGEADLKIDFGQKTIVQRALVIDTSAFQAVLGMDFLSNSRVGGLITQPPPGKLLFDGELFPLMEIKCPQACKRLFRIFKKESYALTQQLRDDILDKLEIQKKDISIDLFANHKNAQETKYCTRENSAWRYNWTSLLEEKKCKYLWANPPFSMLPKVLTKISMEETKVILVTPDWDNQYWSRLLSKNDHCKS